MAQDNKTTQNYLALETIIVKELKNIYDPEIPVNIYDLGLVYNIHVDDQSNVIITMTLTAPGCPIADQIVQEVQMRIGSLDGVKDAEVNLTFDPPWNMDMMSEEAKLELGLL